MKKVFKIIAIIIVLLLIPMGIMIFRLNSEKAKMKPLDTKEVVKNIYAIHDGTVNMYLIKDNQNYVAIDAGNEIENISKGLKETGINPDKVSAIFLTHSDGDHTAAIKLFKNAKVYLSTNEKQMIDGTTNRMLIIKNSLPVDNYTLIKDQEELKIGNVSVKGILNEGHTLGSMSYLIDEKYLFTGDILSIKDGKIAPFNEFFNMDTPTALKTVENISHLDKCEYIFSAHYGFTEYKKGISSLPFIN